MDRRQELIREEDERWAEFERAIEGIGMERLESVRVSDEWSAKDLVAHVACWMAEAGNMLEQMRQGTYEDRKLDIDAMNREFDEACRDLDTRSVMAELQSARTRMLQELYALPELTPGAEEWFRESGAQHLEEHVSDLRRAGEAGG